MKRGEIYYADLGQGIGSEQGGIRPVLIVQNAIGNQHSPTTIILPITSARKKILPVHIPINRSGGLRFHSVVLAEQIRTIDRRRLLGYVGKLGKVSMKDIDDAIKISLEVK